MQVLDPAALETLLQARWSGLRDALSRSDVPAAVALFAGASRDAYRDQLASLAGVGALPQVAAALGAITPVKVLDRAAEYELNARSSGARSTPSTFSSSSTRTVYGDYACSDRGDRCSRGWLARAGPGAPHRMTTLHSGPRRGPIGA